MICEKCGAVLNVGDWPLCGGKHTHAPAKPMVIGDEYPGGKTYEHMAHEPVTVYSKSEERRKMDELGIRRTDRYHPNDGPNWTMAIDAYTLESAKALVSRGVRVDDHPALPVTLTTRVGTLEELT